MARVIDGDTVVVDASADLPAELADLRVRLRGVDTPETGARARCASELRAGQAATAFVEARIAGARTIAVHDPEWGKWGGRVVADLVHDGESLAPMLIETRHGRRYDGRARAPWCAPAGGETAAAAPTRMADDLVDDMLADPSLSVVDLVDGMLAAQDRENAPARPAGGVGTEIERHVMAPCIEAALDEGIVSPGIVQRHGAATAPAT